MDPSLDGPVAVLGPPDAALSTGAADGAAAAAADTEAESVAAAVAAESLADLYTLSA